MKLLDLAELPTIVAKQSRWQRCAGWRTGNQGNRQTRRSPAHSCHKAAMRVRKPLQASRKLSHTVNGSPNPIALLGDGRTISPSPKPAQALRSALPGIIFIL